MTTPPNVLPQEKEALLPGTNVLQFAPGRVGKTTSAANLDMILEGWSCDLSEGARSRADKAEFMLNTAGGALVYSHRKRSKTVFVVLLNDNPVVIEGIDAFEAYALGAMHALNRFPETL